MTAGREVLFLNERCYLTEPGRLFEATGLTSADLVAALSRPSGALADDIDRILAARSRGTYLDYASESALKADHALMVEYLRADPVPPTEPASGEPLIWLPHPAFARLPDLPSAIAELLLMGFGVLRDADFLGLFSVPIKAPPSKGARHPFDAYVVVGRGAGLPSGVFRYVASKHALAPIAEAPAANDGVVIVVTIVFERVHWRYREVSGYCDALLDLGHLIETVQTAAAELKLSLKPARFPEGVSDTPLIEEVVVAWQVDTLPAEYG